ncbi:MAG TPA: ribonuclease P protein component [Candidatus Pacearchaeota archaeon]|nr:ribonuclease P protein component [Candidatus Pacearchaeota archaeon]HOK93979.1 ribonuclease P protein component [Candidatus Pacearchaeota archaeon]HPO75050.1 ribonuclease P protein component [Candidatus Pacearchaeota archaeon]
MLPSQNRLSKKEVEKIFKKNKTFQGNFLLLKTKKNSLLVSRFSVIIPLKVSKKSTQRNKLKRQIREILRENLTNIKPGFDCVFIATPKIIGKKYKEIKEETEKLLKKAEMINK